MGTINRRACLPALQTLRPLHIRVTPFFLTMGTPISQMRKPRHRELGHARLPRGQDGTLTARTRYPKSDTAPPSVPRARHTVPGLDPASLAAPPAVGAGLG